MDYIKIIERAIESGESSYLSDQALNLSGFSSFKVKHLLNNICSEVPDLKYLEIGVMFGSTLISAAFKNKGEFYGIDNFCGFGGPQNEEILKANIERFKDDCTINFTTGDCWSPEVKAKIPEGINVYFFDGEHTYEEQYKALAEYYDKLAYDFIFIVDDWNWDAPREATFKSIEDLKLKVVSSLELFTPDKENGRTDSWWNGLGIYVLQKEKFGIGRRDGIKKN